MTENAIPGEYLFDEKIRFSTFNHKDPAPNFYGRLPSRDRRPVAKNDSECTFCHWVWQENAGVQIINGREVECKTACVSVEGQKYMLGQNSYPILPGQLLAIPFEEQGNKHQEKIRMEEILLALKVVGENGFGSLKLTPHRGDEEALRQFSNDPYINPTDDDKTTTCVYLNPHKESGQSQIHTHPCIVRLLDEYVPCVRLHDWEVSYDERQQVTIRRVLSLAHQTGCLPGHSTYPLPYYAIGLDGKTMNGIATTAAAVHAGLNEIQIPHNIIVVPGSQLKSARVVFIPRRIAVSPTVDQKLAGLEFITRIVIPGPRVKRRLTLADRDHAFREVTYSNSDLIALQVDRMIRGKVGLPQMGNIVIATKLDETSGSAGTCVTCNGELKHSVEKYKAEVTVNRISDELKTAWISPKPTETAPGTDEPGRHNLLVSTTFASVCNSDRRILNGDKKCGFTLPLDALGHESGGFLIDPGPHADVPGYAPGAAVAILPHVTCGKCFNCLRGRSNICIAGVNHLGFHSSGSFRDVGAFAKQAVFPVGADFPLKALPLLEPLACVNRAVDRIRFRLQREIEKEPRRNLLAWILGGGPIGCLFILVFKRWFPELELVIVEPAEQRRRAISDQKILPERQCLSPEQAESGYAPKFIFVTNSCFNSYEQAMRVIDNGGTIVAFSGINKSDIHKKPGMDAKNGNIASIPNRESVQSLPSAKTIEEDIHRNEGIADFHIDNNAGRKMFRIIGSSGYTFNNAYSSMNDLRRNYKSHYARVQNGEVNGFCDDAVAFLQSIDESGNGKTAGSLKVLIRSIIPEADQCK